MEAVGRQYVNIFGDVMAGMLRDYSLIGNVCRWYDKNAKIRRRAGW